MKFKEAVIFMSIGLMLLALVAISLKHSNDDQEKEQQRRAEMYKIIGDEQQ